MLHKLYKKQVEAWKERFTDQWWASTQGRNDQRNDFILSSRHKDTIELIEAEIERRKRMKPLIVDEFEELMLSFHPDENGERITKTWTNIITLIDEDIAYLEENLQKIKKEL